MEFQHTHMGFRVGGEIQPVHINTTDLFWRRRDFCKCTWFSPVLRHTEVPILKHLSTEYKANAFQSWIKSSIWMKSIWRKKGKKKQQNLMLTLSDPKSDPYSLHSSLHHLSLPPDLSSTLPILNSCPILKSGNATIPNTLTHICQVTDSTSPSAHQKLFEPTKPEAPASLNSLNSTRL